MAISTINIDEEITLSLVPERLLNTTILNVERKRPSKTHKIGVELITAQRLIDVSGEISEIVNKFGDGSVSFNKLYHINDDIYAKVGTCGSSIHIDIRRYANKQGENRPMRVGVTIPGSAYTSFICGLTEMLEEAESV